jgi:MazG nucleotide pyrophosphohydrolase domain
LAAVARILEELGEVAEHARKEQQPGELTDACLEEVADLLIVSTCLANQYSVNLAAEYAVAPLSSEQGLVPNLIRALTVAGSISRVVNAIEGTESPRVQYTRRKTMDQDGPVQPDA